MDYAASIRATLDAATPDDWREGRAWYPDAEREADAIAHAAGITPDAAAAIIAALSPRNRWTRNLADALNVATAVRNGEPTPVCATFGANVRKAERIAGGTPWHDVLRGLKVRSFVANITGDRDAVTVDVWAVRAATYGERDLPRSDADYRAIADAYRTVADERGEDPRDVQAVAWIVTRNARIGQVVKGERKVRAA